MNEIERWQQVVESFQSLLQWHYYFEVGLCIFILVGTVLMYYAARAQFLGRTVPFKQLKLNKRYRLILFYRYVAIVMTGDDNRYLFVELLPPDNFPKDATAFRIIMKDDKRLVVDASDPGFDNGHPLVPPMEPPDDESPSAPPPGGNGNA